MVLITSLFVVEFYYFSMNFREGVADSVLFYHLEVEKCAHAQSKSFPICNI